MKDGRSKNEVITTVDQLGELLQLASEEQEGIRKCRAIMPMKITRSYAKLLDPNDPHDPLRRIVIPSTDELAIYPDDDIVDNHKDEAKYQPIDGIIHRYPGKVLLMYTTGCFAHCRFCFRSEKVVFTLSGRRLDRAIEYLRENESIRDVVFTGGDPFYGNIDRLGHALAEVRRIPHVEIIRITTRAPVYVPQMFDDRLVEMLSQFKPLFMLISFIHPHLITLDQNNDKVRTIG